MVPLNSLVTCAAPLPSSMTNSLRRPAVYGRPLHPWKSGQEVKDTTFRQRHIVGGSREKVHGARALLARNIDEILNDGLPSGTTFLDLINLSRCL